jgi:hypothetical protein
LATRGIFEERRGCTNSDLIRGIVQRVLEHPDKFRSEVVIQVGGYLLDGIRHNFISGAEHVADGFRRMGDVSFPCFTTPGGRRAL